MISIITSKDNAKVKEACSLKLSKNRKAKHLFLIEGKKILDLALASNLVDSIFTLKELNVDSSINQYVINEAVMEKLSFESSPEGIVAICKMPSFDTKTFNKIIYLDNINDPGNLGTIIRTASSFNYDAVVTSKNSCDIFNEKVIAASKGSIFKIPVFEADLNNIKQSHTVVSTALSDKSIDIASLPKLDKFILVLGNEAHGISEEILANSDYQVIIPISNMESLNVSIAGGIAMYLLK